MAEQDIAKRPSTRKALHFGAGNIGRGFIAPLLTRAGFHVTFVDINESVIENLNKNRNYDVHILDNESRVEHVYHVSGRVANHPDIVNKFIDLDLVTTSIGVSVLPNIAPVIAEGLKKRALDAPDRGPMDIVACENMVGATAFLKEQVLKHIDDPRVRTFLDTNVGFANCSVDRIVPPFEVPRNDQPLDVGVEGFYEWAVDRTALKAHLNVDGVKLVDRLEAYVERKLYTLNTGHAIIAYLGYLKSHPTVDASLDDPQISETVRGALHESGAALCRKHGFSEAEHHAYIDTILDQRLRNPNIHDEVTRVCRGPKRKLGRHDRLVGPVLMASGYGLPFDHLTKGIAAALLYDYDGDAEAKEVQKLVQQLGLEDALVQLTGLAREGQEGDIVKKVLADHSELKSLRSAASK
ncbi:hypothetical protein PLICRDRAFT_598200 [Plicaturopsis crispa FD-325 SS-3]|nr:hypothetical protein PLICRDRAFT_598200 [Plicaturopsis crispa FD-325 SS-3]